MVEFDLNAGIVARDGESIPDGIERAVDLGVDAVEFFDWEGADLDAVQQTASEQGVHIAGVLAGGAGSTIEDQDAPALVDPDDHDTAVADLERSLEAAADLDADVLIVTVGPDQDGLDRNTQRGAIEAVLESVGPTAESVGVTVVVEPLNTHVDHPGYFLTDSETAFEITRAVDSDAVQVLYDVYHQQITEGDIIRTVTDNIDAIGHVHVADTPGRHEPGTGELDYANIFDALDETGYAGYVGLEFFSASDGTDMDEAIRSTLALD